MLTRLYPHHSASGDARRGGSKAPGTAESGPVGGGAWFADDDAHRRHEDNRGPETDSTDQRIEAAVVSRLKGERSLDASDVSVSVSHGAVTLTGVVDTPAAKTLAETCAAGATGVRQIHNSLRVEAPGQLD